MSNRHTLLRAIGQLTVATTDELADAIPGFTRQKLRDTLTDCKKAGYLVRQRDDVTGNPAYRLTPLGKTALEAGPQPGKKHGATHDTQPAVVRNTGNQASATDAPPVEGLVVESPQPTGNTAAADSHVGPDLVATVESVAALAIEAKKPRSALEMAVDHHNLIGAICKAARFDESRALDELPQVIDDLYLGLSAEITALHRDYDEQRLAAHRCYESQAEIFSALDLPFGTRADDQDTLDFVVEQIQAMKRDSENLDSILSVNRKFCGWVAETFPVDGRLPVNLYECQQQLVDYYEHKLSEYAGELADREIEIHELEIDLNAASTVGPVVDMVNSPPHYQGKVECIDAIESALGPVGFHAYCRGNALKYTFRAGRKSDAATDLAKAAWYLARIAP